MKLFIAQHGSLCGGLIRFFGQRRLVQDGGDIFLVERRCFKMASGLCREKRIDRCFCRYADENRRQDEGQAGNQAVQFNEASSESLPSLHDRPPGRGRRHP